MRVGGQRQPWPFYAREKDPVPIVQEAGCAPGPVWTGAENLALHRDSVPGPSSPYGDSWFINIHEKVYLWHYVNCIMDRYTCRSNSQITTSKSALY
jgi:hypothetical protein